MTPILSTLIQQYEEAFPHADPRTRNWILVWDSPVYVWAISAIYMLIIWLGPKVMAKRAPFKLQNFLVVYNLALVALSVYMFLEMILSTIHAGYNYVCDPYNSETHKNPKELRMAKVMWWYFFSKSIELFDTVLMIVRKKFEQITFLHVYHHISMLNIWWWVMMFIPGGLSWFGACINSLVHVVMYLYYGLSSIPSMRNKLWWKRYITRFQLTQFVITFTHSCTMYFSGCDFPKWGKILLIGYMVSMVILFSNFYFQAYLRKSRQRKAKLSVNGATNGVSNGAVGRDLNNVVNGKFGVNGTTNGHIIPSEAAKKIK